MVLSAEDNVKAVAPVTDGKRQWYVAKLLHMILSIIQRVLERLKEIGENTQKPRSGRKWRTTATDDRFLVLDTLWNHHLTSV